MLRQLLKHSLQTFLPRQLFMVRGVGNTCADTIRVALTFDDGPDAEFTPAVLDELGAYKIPATFFVIGENAENNDELIQRIVEEGHELANHTYTHSEPAETSTLKFLDEIQRTDDLLGKLTGRTWPLIRPPKGELSPGKLWRLLRNRRPVVLWTADPKDYQVQNHAELHHWCEQVTPTDGEIVLMHDNRPWAAKLIPLLAEWRDRHQVEFVRVGDWLDLYSREPERNEVPA